VSLRVVSFGAGVQSTALLVLAAQGAIDFRTFLFANVGSDSEHPATLRYLREVAVPFAAAHGLALHELHRVLRDGRRETLYGRLMRPGSRSLPIPVRMPDTGAPGRRACTADFKIAPIARWLRSNGADRTNPAVVAIGFSTDEIHRCNKKAVQPWEVPEYPLIDLGMNRAACQAVIARAGLPVPPRSACWFCPYRRPAAWAEARRDTPGLFWRAVELERTLNRRRDRLGRDRVYLTRFGRPLDEAIPEAQPAMFV
jgi:hypothetical protein